MGILRIYYYNEGTLLRRIVFGFENGSYRSFGGYTRDMSHLPDNFREVNDLINDIVQAVEE